MSPSNIPIGEIVVVSVVLKVLVDIADVDCDVDSWMLVEVDWLNAVIVSFLVGESLPEYELWVVVSSSMASLLVDFAHGVVVLTIESVVGVIEGPYDHFIFYLLKVEIEIDVIILFTS